MCHILCNHLLKHFWNIRTMLSHLTYMFTSLLHRDIRLVVSLTDLQVLRNWHTLYSQSPQMSPGNWPGLAAQLSVAQIVSALVHISHEIVAVQETTTLSRSWWTSHKYPTFFWIFSTKKVIGPATPSYDLFMNTWAVFQVPYNTARHILFLLIFHISSGILAVEELWLLAMLLNTLQVSFMLLYVV